MIPHSSISTSCRRVPAERRRNVVARTSLPPDAVLDAIVKKEVCGAELTGILKRSAFGMKSGVPGLGDDVKLTVQVEAIKD